MYMFNACSFYYTNALRGKHVVNKAAWCWCWLTHVPEQRAMLELPPRDQSLLRSQLSRQRCFRAEEHYRSKTSTLLSLSSRRVTALVCMCHMQAAYRSCCKQPKLILYTLNIFWTKCRELNLIWIAFPYNRIKKTVWNLTKGSVKKACLFYYINTAIFFWKWLKIKYKVSRSPSVHIILLMSMNSVYLWSYIVKNVILFRKDALNQSKVTVKIFILLNTFISNKYLNLRQRIGNGGFKIWKKKLWYRLHR